MSTRLFPHVYHEAISATQHFVEASNDFLRYWIHDFRYDITSFFSLASAIRTLPYIINNSFYAQISDGKKEEVDSHQEEVENVMFEIEEQMVRVSFSLPIVDRRWEYELERMWRLFDRVYNELRNVLGGFRRYPFDLDEKLVWRATSD
ncbi:hypothetical protein [Paenibacillus lupini]|uniref:hypothetical protein n=1 Tax=Paenibacillus lupini TaxID=1450204 RepID=UPI0014202BC9|nr:hypothetical protein [Paenibacillus lupini]NIK26196.1 hypothetical protein [Paenibacillus lupini]